MDQYPYRFNLLPLAFLPLFQSQLATAIPIIDYEGVVPGSVVDSGSNLPTGSSGADGGSIRLPRGALIAIIIVVVIVVLVGVTMGALYYQAKRRQWTMRETMRYSARRVAESIKSPLTPSFRRRGQHPMTPAGARATASQRPPLQPKNPMSQYQNRSGQTNDKLPRIEEDGKTNFNFSKLVSFNKSSG